MGAYLNNDAAIAPSGLAQLYGIGQISARTSGRRPPAAPRFLDTDYQVRGGRVQQDRLTNCRV
ncbi:hypothetical protein GCM10017620_27020 [Brevundimonas intermedia]|uniref:Uncharacterized protein n=1 Tax=Brevundimonas intermedia TaxID=74315 RepID=A0ABQ5TA87_9CAUL|nr:hypothetical protein GCM10017620_27020 [Brevundimonas intermedia]